jgi:hypothetical protein
VISSISVFILVTPYCLVLALVSGFDFLRIKLNHHEVFYFAKNLSAGFAKRKMFLEAFFTDRDRSVLAHKNGESNFFMALATPFHFFFHRSSPFLIV